jgi:hypothetical protein
MPRTFNSEIGDALVAPRDEEDFDVNSLGFKDEELAQLLAEQDAIADRIRQVHAETFQIPCQEREMNIQRRLKALEQRLIRPPIVLRMPDGRTERLSGRGNSVFDLLFRAAHGERTPEIELIAQSVSSTEPGGGHMIDLARALLQEPEAGHPVNLR